MSPKKTKGNGKTVAPLRFNISGDTFVPSRSECTGKKLWNQARSWPALMEARDDGSVFVKGVDLSLRTSVVNVIAILSPVVDAAALVLDDDLLQVGLQLWIDRQSAFEIAQEERGLLFHSGAGICGPGSFWISELQ